MQVNLYADGGAAGSALTPMPDGVIDDLNGDGQVTLADVDNYPFNWRPDLQFLEDGVTANPVWTGSPGTEDVDRNGNGVFDAGDAIAIATTDSSDDNQPTDCPGDPTDPFLPERQVLRRPAQLQPGADRLCSTAAMPSPNTCPAAWTPGPPRRIPCRKGTYIVEATRPPGYELVKEEDRNVDFGDTYTP